MKSYRVCLALMALLIASSLAPAQTIPTGKLVGTVTDQDGAPLPGVSITIKSPSLILPQMSTESSEAGYFRFLTLPSGKYQVKFEMPGMKSVIREEMVVSAGLTTTLDLVLEQSPVEEEVTVIGKAPTVDLEKNKTGTTFTSDLLQGLPLPRDFHAIYNIAPGMFSRTSHGSDARSNKFTVDGVMHQDPVTGDPIMEIGFNAIEEVIVDTGGHQAEYGSVKGALVQVLTKSGGNNFSGETPLFFRNKKMQSDNTKGTPFVGQFVGFDYRFQPGLSLGGPIQKDKLWFFTSMNIDSQVFYVQGFPAYGTQAEPCHLDIYIPFLKFTWQLTPKDRIVASGYWHGYFQDNRDANQWRTVDTTFKEDRGGWLGTIQWTRTFTNNFLFNLKAAYYDFHQTLLAKTNKPPYVDTKDSVITGGIGSDWWYTRDRFQLNQDATFFKDNWFGRHEFKAGMNFEYSFDSTDTQYYSDPRFEGKFPAGFKAVDVTLVNGVPTWVWVGEEFTKDDDLIQLGLFAQDTWSPTKRLAVNLGLRYDYSLGRFPPQKRKGSDVWVNEKTINAMELHTVSPRLGLSFDPFGNGKTVLRAHYGRYHQPLIMILYYFGNPNQRRSFSVRLNPDWTEWYRTGVYEPTTNYIDPDIRSPYADEINFGFEREIIEDLSFSATFIAKWEKDLIEDVDSNHLNMDLLKKSGELKWTGYNEKKGIDPKTGQSITYYEMRPDFGTYRWYYTNIPGTLRKYRGLELKAIKRMSKNWAMQASYVWSKGEGLLNTTRDQSTGVSGYYNNPNVHINATGRLDFQREHMVRIQTIYIAPLGFLLSAHYQFGSGVPYTRSLRSLEAGLGSLYQGIVTILAEPRGTYQLPDQHLLDIRVEKDFRLGPGHLCLMADVFNVFNANTTTSVGVRTNVDFQRVYGILGPRYLSIGAAYRF